MDEELPTLFSRVNVDGVWFRCIYVMNPCEEVDEDGNVLVEACFLEDK